MTITRINMNAAQYLALLGKQPIKRIVFIKRVHEVAGAKIKTIEVVRVDH